MTTWTARRLAWSVGIGSIALLLAALVLMFVDRGSDLPDNVGIWSAADVVDVLVNIGVPILGIVIVNKRPRNAIGWVFIVAGAALALAELRAGLRAPRPRRRSRNPAGRAGAGLAQQRPVADPDRLLSPCCSSCSRPDTSRLHAGVPSSGSSGSSSSLLTIASLILATAGWSDPFEGHQRGRRIRRRRRPSRDRDRRARGDRRVAVLGRVARRSLPAFHRRRTAPAEVVRLGGRDRRRGVQRRVLLRLGRRLGRSSRSRCCSCTSRSGSRW